MRVGFIFELDQGEIARYFGVRFHSGTFHDGNLMAILGFRHSREEESEEGTSSHNGNAENFESPDEKPLTGIDGHEPLVELVPMDITECGGFAVGFRHKDCHCPHV